MLRPINCLILITILHLTSALKTANGLKAAHSPQLTSTISTGEKVAGATAAAGGAVVVASATATATGLGFTGQESQLVRLQPASRQGLAM